MNDIYEIAVVSGKGGVGKTMLAVAIAKELASRSRTLLVDLDIFNRGLSALLRSERVLTRTPVAPPPHFADVIQQLSRQSRDFERIVKEEGLLNQWFLVELRDNLVFLQYPELPPAAMRQLEGIPVQDVISRFAQYTTKLAEISQCRNVVYDCHGGPDNTSFAATFLADHTLLVSEPDVITMEGTIRFVEGLYAVEEELQRAKTKVRFDVRLVYNKVLPDAFRAKFLASMYDRELRGVFGRNPIAGIYPLELYLIKEFEKHPFVTELYPDSHLARKTKVLLRELLAHRAKDRLDESVFAIPAWLVRWQKNSLGKKLWLLNPSVVQLPFLIFMYLSFLSFAIVGSSFRRGLVNLGTLDPAYAGVLRGVGNALQASFGVMAGWLVIVIVWTCYVYLDRAMMYHFRLGNLQRTAALLIGVIAIWVFPVATNAMFIWLWTELPPMQPGAEKLQKQFVIRSVLLLMVLAVMFLVVAGNQLVNAYTEVRFGAAPFELSRLRKRAGLRLAYVAILFTTFVLMGYFVYRVLHGAPNLPNGPI